MRCVLVHAFAGVVLLAASPAGAYERPELVPSSPPGAEYGLGLEVSAIDRAPASDLFADDTTPSATAKEPVAAPSLAPPPPPPPVTLLLRADLAAQKVTVSLGDEVLHVWPISSGRRGYATPTGTFRPSWMARMWRSRQYDDAPMPHAIFFNSGIAFHATSAVSMLGRPASHGCLRLSPAHAAELYALVRGHGLAHTKVVVEGSAPFPLIAVARRQPAERKRDVVAGSNAPLFSAAQWLFMQ
jgi:hypothetical protein